MARKSGIKFKEPTPLKHLAPAVMAKFKKIYTQFDFIEEEVAKPPSLGIKTGTFSASKAAYGSILEDSVFLKPRAPPPLPIKKRPIS